MRLINSTSKKKIPIEIIFVLITFSSSVIYNLLTLGKINIIGGVIKLAFSGILVITTIGIIFRKKLARFFTIGLCFVEFIITVLRIVKGGGILIPSVKLLLYFLLINILIFRDDIKEYFKI